MNKKKLLLLCFLVSGGAFADAMTQRVLRSCVRLPNLQTKLNEITYVHRPCGNGETCTLGILPIRYRTEEVVLFLGFQTVVAAGGQATEVRIIDTERTVQTWERREFRSTELRGPAERNADARAEITRQVNFFQQDFGDMACAAARENP